MRLVTWTMPESAAALLRQTLEADASAMNFDPVLRVRIQTALDAIHVEGSNRHKLTITINPCALVGVCACGALWSVPKAKGSRAALGVLFEKHLAYVKGAQP